MVFDSQHAVNANLGKLMPVLVGILFVGLPLYVQLSWLVLWLVFVFTMWSLLIIRRTVRPPGAWLRFVLAVLIIAVLIASYGTVFGLIPGTSMLILLSYLKLFEIKGKRDIAVVIFIGYFLASSAFFHSQSVWMAIYVFVLVVYLTSLLMLIADRKDSVDWRGRMRYSARMVLQSLPLMLIMFVLFPRIPGPLWGLPSDALSAATGLSEEMTPGDMSKLVASYDVAFRVKFENKLPQNRDLYWRGLVLSDYDGETWRRDDAPSWTMPDVVSLSAADDEIRYTVTLEPHQENWLYTLEQITVFDGDYSITRELQVFAQDRISNVTSYTMRASLDVINQGLFEPERRKNLELPVGLNPKTLELGRRIREQAQTDGRKIIASVLRFFYEQEFFYTLSPPLLGEHAMDDFLFDSRRGFCEHYASAFVYLMRAAGVPARVVLGYQGGELNPLDEYMIVRQSDAHAWVEVWVDNQYWLRVDPTAAVAPQRIERGIENSGLDARSLPRMLMIDNAVLKRARFMWDSFQYNWNQWVVGFDGKRQLELFEKLGISDIGGRNLVLLLVATMSAAGLLVAWWVIGFNQYDRKDRIRMYYDRFRRKLARRGIVVAAQDTPQELLGKIQQGLPDVINEASGIVKLYQSLVYGMSRNRETEKIFIRAVRQFHV